MWFFVNRVIYQTPHWEHFENILFILRARRAHSAQKVPLDEMLSYLLIRYGRWRERRIRHCAFWQGLLSKVQCEKPSGSLRPHTFSGFCAWATNCWKAAVSALASPLSWEKGIREINYCFICTLLLSGSNVPTTKLENPFSWNGTESKAILGSHDKWCLSSTT